MSEVETYEDWCRERACDHAHCPLDCDHPQPFVSSEGVLYCGRCWVQDGLKTVMDPCVPTICADAH